MDKLLWKIYNTNYQFYGEMSMLKNRSRHKFIKIIFITKIVILILLARAKYKKMKPEKEITKKI